MNSWNAQSHIAGQESCLRGGMLCCKVQVISEEVTQAHTLVQEVGRGEKGGRGGERGGHLLLWLARDSGLKEKGSLLSVTIFPPMAVPLWGRPSRRWCHDRLDERPRSENSRT